MVKKPMSRDGGRAVLDSFLRWAHEAIARDPTHRADIEKALAETTMSPELRRAAEAEIEVLAEEHRPSPASGKAMAERVQ